MGTRQQEGGDRELYLIRHGLAEERGPAWPDDTRRPLTDRGMARLRKEARALDAMGVVFDAVLTSPLVRTRQTAEIIASGFNPRPPVITLDALAPEGSAVAVLAALEAHGKRTRLALVGHEPGIGELAARLLGARRIVPFKKGAVCRIDVDALPPVGPGTLRWFLTPAMLRALRP
jgi:phosphohistidine phosphatase